MSSLLNCLSMASDYFQIGIINWILTSCFDAVVFVMSKLCLNNVFFFTKKFIKKNIAVLHPNIDTFLTEPVDIRVIPI